jgi:hypothetical protein
MNNKAGSCLPVSAGEWRITNQRLLNEEVLNEEVLNEEKLVSELIKYASWSSLHCTLIERN